MSSAGIAVVISLFSSALSILFIYAIYAIYFIYFIYFKYSNLYLNYLFITQLNPSLRLLINRLFLIHFTFGFIIKALVYAHLFTLHSFYSYNPLFNTLSSLIVPFYTLFYNDLFVTFLSVSLAFSYTLLYFPDLFGNSDNLIFANPVSTPDHILPE
jgi:ubiquinol-cytochrome c reductase cytochrome b subunit